LTQAHVAAPTAINTHHAAKQHRQAPPPPPHTHTYTQQHPLTPRCKQAWAPRRIQRAWSRRGPSSRPSWCRGAGAPAGVRPGRQRRAQRCRQEAVNQRPPSSYDRVARPPPTTALLTRPPGTGASCAPGAVPCRCAAHRRGRRSCGAALVAVAGCGWGRAAQGTGGAGGVTAGAGGGELM
jgi:hypothetical protein